MKFAVVVGSLRKDSYNMQLARTIIERFRGDFEAEMADLRTLPHYDQDIETNPPETVLEFKRQIREADGVIMITPEFNWSIPGVLKNALDWLSRADQEMVDKPVMIAGVSSGQMGTIRAQLHLRQILSSPGIQAKVLPPAGNELLINQAASKFQQGRLTDEPTLELVDRVVRRFIDFAAKTE